MEVTTDFIKSSFDKFNKEYFNGALVTPTFEVSHCRRALGDFLRRGKYYRIRVSDYYIRSQREIEQTILHEMIHLYQNQFNCRDKSHGIDFKEKAFDINCKGGWHISRLTSTKGCQVNPKYAKSVSRNKSKESYMMVYKSVTGKYFLFRMALRCVNQWVNTIRYIKSVTKYVTFTSTNGEFDDYPACRTSCRGSYITEERFNELVNKYKLKVQENLSCSRKIAV